MTTTERFYPLRFAPALHAKVWGGQNLAARLGKDISSQEPIGESWEIYFKNTIANGEFTGRTLASVIEQYPVEMTGRPNASPEFPLLIKFLDAQEWLSVQVHPDDALAAKLEGEPRGKTECWYVIYADPGAKLAYGLSEALDATSFRAAIEAGRSKEIIQYVEVSAGDFVYVPAGTVHALGPGIVIYELQQTSDTTYRVYDWDRMGLDGKPRPLHIDKSIICTHYDVNPPAKVPYTLTSINEGVSHVRLVRQQYFQLDKYVLNAPLTLHTAPAGATTKPHLLTALRGHIEWSAPGHTPMMLPQGTSAFLPAAIGDYQLIPDGEAEILVAQE